MNSYKNRIQCEIRGNTGKTTVNNNYTQVSLKNDKVKQSIFNNKENFVSNKESDELDEILEKLLIAYEYMTPAVEEIINTVSNFIMPKLPTYEQDDPICSITTEQYDEVIKAVMLIKDATAKKRVGSNSILSRFSLDKFLNAIKCSIKVGSVTTSSFRVYLAKTVVNELILLYKLLYDEIQDINYSSDGESEITPSTQRRISSISQKLHHNIIENSEKLASLEAEYQALSDTINILKSVISETTGSGYDIMSTPKSATDALTKIKLSNSVSSLKTNQCITDASGARRCILECLYELTEVRRHLKFSNSKDDLDIKSNDTSTTSKITCCNNGEMPHLQAKLNRIPIVLTLNKIQWYFYKTQIRHCNLNNDSNIPKIFCPKNNLTQYQLIRRNVLVSEKVIKHKSIYTSATSNYLSYNAGQEPKSISKNKQTHGNCSLNFQNKKEILLKLHYYIYLSNNIYEHVRKVYEVRFFEIEQDIPSKLKVSQNAQREPVNKNTQIKKEVCSNIDDLGWNSDTLEVRVFEFKRKNVPKAQEIIKQLKTKMKLGHLNNVNNESSSVKSSTLFSNQLSNQQDTSLVNVFTYTKKSAKDSKYNVERNRFVRHNFDSCCQQSKVSVKTCNVGMNTTNANVKRKPLQQTHKIFDKVSSLYNYSDLNLSRLRTKELQTSQFKERQYVDLDKYKYTIKVSSNNLEENNELMYVPSWKISKYEQHSRSFDLYSSNFEKKLTKNKSVQCNFFNTTTKTTTCETLPTCIPTKDIYYLSSPTNTSCDCSKPDNKILTLNTKPEKTTNSRTRKNKHRSYLLRKKLSTFNKNSDKYLKMTINKIGLKNIFHDESVYSLKINSNISIQKNASAKTNRFTTEILNGKCRFLNATQEVQRETKSKSKSNLIYTQKDTHIGDCNIGYQTDLQNVIINLVQTKASIAFENLSFKVDRIKNHHNVSDGTTTKNKTLENINMIQQKSNKIRDLYFKENNESLSENNITCIRSTYSSIQFVYGDVTPTQNHKIFGVSRSISNMNEIKIDESTRQCNLKINVGKEILVTHKNFDYSKYSSLVQPLSNPRMMSQKIKEKSKKTFESMRSNYKKTTKDKINRLDYPFDTSYMQFHCHKSTQLPPVTYRNKSLLRRIVLPRPFYKEI